MQVELSANDTIDYLDLEGDDARRAIWLRDVPLSETHKLRAKLNRGRSGPVVKVDDEVEAIGEMLQEFEMPVVASVLRLYLLELPGKIHLPILSPANPLLTSI